MHFSDDNLEVLGAKIAGYAKLTRARMRQRFWTVLGARSILCASASSTMVI
jgi:hypothetical protein